MPPTDAELLQNVKDSDMESFRILFDRYQPPVFRQLFFQTHDSDLSHDIVQETFVRVWEHREGIKPHLSFLAYLLRISGNLVRDSVRHQRIRERLAGDVPVPRASAGDDPEEALQLSMVREEVLRVVHEDVPARCRTIFLLSRFEGKSNREIADLLGISVRTVEHQINKALKVLRRKLRRFLADRTA